MEGRLAGKTGTSQNHSDGWFIGFTPKLLAGVWTGAESPAVRFRNIHDGQGANLALPIWGEFMKALKDDERYAALLAGDFPEGSEVVQEQLACPTRPVARVRKVEPTPAQIVQVLPSENRVAEQKVGVVDRAQEPQ